MYNIDVYSILYYNLILFMLSLEEINNRVSKDYNSKLQKTTSFIDDSLINNVYIKDKSVFVDTSVIRYIIGRYLTIDEVYRIKDLDIIIDSLDKDSFFSAIERIYDNWDMNIKTKNILLLYSILGNNYSLISLYNSAKNISSNRYKLSSFYLEVISLSNTNLGYYFIYEALKTFKQNSIREKAQEILDSKIKELDTTEEEFVDSIIPNFNFNSNGIRYYNNEDNKKYRILFKDNISFSFYDEIKEKELKTIPSVFPDILKKEISNLKSVIKNIIKIEKNRLIIDFISGRQWKYRNWREIFCDNPIIKRFSISLIWCIYDRDDNYIDSFRYMDDGSFNNAFDEEIFISDDSYISLFISYNVDNDIINSWIEQLSDYEIIQPFHQLSNMNFEELKEKISNSTSTLSSLNKMFNDLGFTKYSIDNVFYGYYLYDSYSCSNISIFSDGMYYGASYTDTINIHISISTNSDRFLYGIYFLMSDYLN